MPREYNYKHINVICPECKNNQILVDDFHQETYCTKCGLVLQDNTIFKEHWSGVPFPSPGDLSNPEIEPRSPTLQAGALLSEPI